MFPRFQLTQIAEVTTSVYRRITRSKTLRNAFVKKYLDVFDTYVKNKEYAETYGQT